MRWLPRQQFELLRERCAVDLMVLPFLREMTVFAGRCLSWVTRTLWHGPETATAALGRRKTARTLWGAAAASSQSEDVAIWMGCGSPLHAAAHDIKTHLNLAPFDNLLFSGTKVLLLSQSSS
jgi:hypothetical protein